MQIPTVGDACCAALSALNLTSILYRPMSPAYEAAQKTYFSIQGSSLRPACILAPSTLAEVSIAVRALTQNTTNVLTVTSGPPSTELPGFTPTTTTTITRSCPFAIRSGGHMAMAGAANINNTGVTLDLSKINSIVVSADRSKVTVGPGARWDAVYAVLEPLNLMVVGGRSAGVGVGGLVLGGGISYFSPRFGFACDMVLGFKVMLADGSIVWAPGDSELAVALRGGSNNLGVVISIELKTFVQGQLWGGVTYHGLETASQQWDAFVDINRAAGYDEYASMIMSFGYSGVQGGAAFANLIEYTKPEVEPPVYKKLMNITRQYSTMRIAGMNNLVAETKVLQPSGFRSYYSEVTIKSTVEMLQGVFDAWNATLAQVRTITGIVWTISLEPLPPAIYLKKPGSNSLGLGDRTDALVVVLFTASWINEADDQKVSTVAKSLMTSINSQAHAKGLDDRYVYLNYAAPWQDPVSGYGTNSLRHLRRMSQKYDPLGAFQTNVAGGFKIKFGS